MTHEDKQGLSILLALILVFVVFFSLLYDAEQKLKYAKKDINNWEQIIITHKSYEKSYYVKKQMFNGRFYYEGDEYNPAKYTIEYYIPATDKSYIQRISVEEYNNICVGDTVYKFKY